MGEESLRSLSAIVTGATRGIGREITLALARRGVDLTLVARDEEDLAMICAEVEAAGARALAVPADLADPESPSGIVQAAVSYYGRIDILINNAGAAHAAPLAETPTEVFDRLIAVNARAPFILCREAIPHLRKSDRASIINISSVVAHKGYPNQSAYSASKHALLGLTKSLARELHADGVRVHAISPGGVATSMVTGVRPDIDPGELIEPREIADIAVYLLTHRANAMIDEVRVRRASSEPAF